MTPRTWRKKDERIRSLCVTRVLVVSYGSSGNGSANHLAGVMFQGMTGTKLIHVPFKGAGPASIALMKGRKNSGEEQTRLGGNCF